MIDGTDHGYRRLAAATLKLAVWDAEHSRDPRIKAATRRWLAESEVARILLGELGIAQDRARRWVESLPELQQPMLNL